MRCLFLSSIFCILFSVSCRTDVRDIKALAENPSEVEMLDLSNMGLSEAPDELKLFTNLRVLNLAGNAFEKLPDEVLTFQNLEVLHLGGNRLKVLPENLAVWPQLKSLNLASNSIAELPASVKQLKSLMYLNVSWNFLDSLPFEKGDLPELKHLLAYDSPISHVDSLKKVYAQIDFAVDYCMEQSRAVYFQAKAQNYLSIGNKEDAMYYLDRALEVDRNLATCWLLRGRIKLLGNDSNPDAMNDFDKALSINPRLAEAYMVRGILFYNQGNASKACEDWKKGSALGDPMAAQYLNQFCK